MLKIKICLLLQTPRIMQQQPNSLQGAGASPAESVTNSSRTCAPDPGNAGGGIAIQTATATRTGWFFLCLIIFFLIGDEAMTVLIFANGLIDDVDWIRPYLKQATAVIAANGGSRHLKALNHPPDLVIGDMDSIPDDVRLWLETSGCQFETYPEAKDETDLELALLYAAENYAVEIVIIGALGGRLDQTLANIMLLAHPVLAGRPVFLSNNQERAWLVSQGTEIFGSPGDIVSLIPLGGDVIVREAVGFKWEIQDERLVFGPARGISNVMTAEMASVILDQGQLLCIHTHVG
jgi:thiamine pyrophosphokinase